MPTLSAKAIGLIVAVVAVLALIGGGYLFLEKQVTQAYANGSRDGQNAAAAAVNKATADQLRAESAARTAQQQATLDRLAELERRQAQSDQQFNASIGKLLSHDLAKDAQKHPHLVVDAFNRGTDRTLCLLERASGADRDCGDAAAGAKGGAAAAGADGAAPGQVGAGHAR